MRIVWVDTCGKVHRLQRAVRRLLLPCLSFSALSLLLTLDILLGELRQEAELFAPVRVL